jgi:hypothetical protein
MDFAAGAMPEDEIFPAQAAVRKNLTKDARL